VAGREWEPAESQFAAFKKHIGFYPFPTTIEHFRVYLDFTGHKLTVYTDHNPLTFIDKMKDKNQKLLRWSLFLQQFDLDIKHIKGKDNIIADVLSRGHLDEGDNL